MQDGRLLDWLRVERAVCMLRDAAPYKENTRKNLQSTSEASRLQVVYHQIQTFKIYTPEVSSGVACSGSVDFEKIPLILNG